MSRTIVLGLGFVLLVCCSGKLAESSSDAQHVADGKLSRDGANALCALKETVQKIGTEGADNLVKKAEDNVTHLKDYRKRVGYFGSQVISLSGRADPDSDDDAKKELKEFCEEAENETRGDLRDAKELYTEIEKDAKKSKEAARATLGEETKDTDSKGLSGVLHRHCGESQGKNKAPSQHCDTDVYNNESDGGKYTISCGTDHTHHRGDASARLHKAFDEWESKKPKKAGGNLKCGAAGENSSSPCTVSEGWKENYEELNVSLSTLEENGHHIENATREGAKRLTSVYLAYKMLKEGKTAGEALQEAKSRLEGNDTDCPDEGKNDSKCLSNEDLLSGARDHFIFPLTIPELLMYVGIPLLVVLIGVVLFCIFRARKKDKKEDVASGSVHQGKGMPSTNIDPF
uniref:Acidic phosphatase n=1 Tax=Trypanosoma brucei TaxID=5691 RepID=Q9NJ13_9TRYP|nr:acidic phosphatase [Trypanosoma brucei]